jgi:hypothetical protein
LEIVVNNEKIDFTLENERSLGEVVAAVEAWLNKSNLVVASINLELRDSANQKRDITEEPEENWAGTPLDEIECLDITARLVKEIQFSNIQTVFSYLELLKSALEKKDSSKIEHLLQGREDTFKSLNVIYASSLNPNSFQEISDLQSLLAGANAKTILEWPDGVRKKALDYIEVLKGMLSGRLDEMTNPFSVLASSIKQLELTSDEIKEVSVLLQTGQEQKAMAVIIEFADLSQRLLRVLSSLEESSHISLKKLKIGEERANGFFADFNGILRELLGAFDTKDTVLIGDLLEYEVAPRIELFLSFLREVQNSQSKKQ